MWEALAGLLAIAAALVKFYLDEKSRREDDHTLDDINEMDRALADRDGRRISALFERLRKKRGSGGGHSGRSGSAADE